MKITVKKKSYDEVAAMPRPEHKNPRKPWWILRLIIWIGSLPSLWKTKFSYTTEGMENWNGEPSLILMNHSSFIDLKIAHHIFRKQPFCVVCTSDAFVGFGMSLLMRLIGCIPTQKFVTDATLVRDILYAINELKCSVLMFPEASYSFDGTATPLPESLGKCLKLLQVPVVTVMTQGAFARDPLYNGLQLRKTNVSAHVKYLFSAEDTKTKHAKVLNAGLAEAFDYDHFRWQFDNQVRVAEPFRADYLNRILYKCPHCGVEGKMVGKGIHVSCGACGKKYELTEYGKLAALDGESAFEFVPDWYAWERAEVRKEIEAGTYSLDLPVDICMMVNYKAIYRVGTGRLTHSNEGFHLTGCDGKIDYEQKPAANYGLYSDYYWYELGDMICIGDKDCLYYCFPQGGGDVVAKTRMAAEELYKMYGKKPRRTRAEREAAKAAAAAGESAEA